MDRQSYALIESALLYMIGGYDINAIAAVSRLSGFSGSDDEGAFSLRQREGRRLLRRILSLCHANIAPVQMALLRCSQSSLLFGRAFMMKPAPDCGGALQSQLMITSAWLAAA